MKKLPHFMKSSLSTDVLVCAAFALLLIGLANTAIGQQPNEPPYSKNPANLPHALANLQSGKFSPNDVELVARMGATQATPFLEDQFNRAKDVDSKRQLASALVSLRDKDDTYWNYLAARANEAIDRGAPDPYRYDSSGKVQPEKPSDEFVAWAKQQNLDASTAFNQIILNDFATIFQLAKCKDKRAIPSLRRALSSPIPYIQMSAALGLADLDDKDSIPLIIQACKSAPAENASVIAQALVYFNDLSAQRAVDTYVPPQTAKILRDARARGKRPFD